MMNRDKGKVTIFMAIIFPVWIGALALVVVGGGRTRAFQRADNIAAEAARTGAQAIKLGQAVQGNAKELDPVRATAAATSYMTTAGATGTVTVDIAGQTITVHANLEYKNPSGLGFLGGGTWTATGEATARILVG